MTTDYQLGDRVTFTHTLHRRGRGLPERAWTIVRKEWTVEDYDGHTPPPNPREGLVIGKRTLVNGDRDYLGFEEGYGFIPREYVTAYVVAYDMRRKPVYVLPEHLAPKETRDA